MEGNTVSVPRYDKTDRDNMRHFLQKAAPLIDRIATNEIPFASPRSAELIDALAALLGYDRETQKDEDELQELKEDRQSIINLLGAEKRNLDLPELYAQLGGLLRKYGLFDEEVALLENALANGGLSEAKRGSVEDRLRFARQVREADEAAMDEAERTAEMLRRALRKTPPDEEEIKAALEQCTDDAVLYGAACGTDKDPDRRSVRKKAARMLRSRDYRYALSSHILNDARTSMILDLYDPLEGDDLFIARTILTDPNDVNKTHMLLYCKDEALLMLGWRYVYGAGSTCKERLHDMGSPFPEAFAEMDPEEKSRYLREWLAHAAEIALDILSEDEAVRGRISAPASVDSEPLHFFLSFHHPRPAVRWWHARRLENPAYIAYTGSWTSDDAVKEALSVKLHSAKVITDMIYGDLSGLDLVFGFRKPEDLTLQDRFCAEILKNHPDPAIREHVRTELLRGNVEIPGVDLTKPDPLYKKSL